MASSAKKQLGLAIILAILLHFALLLPAMYWLLSTDDSQGAAERFEVSLWDPNALKEKEEKTPEEELDD